jgi:branched-chain amino acid transport system substrate-binding protein
LGTGSALLAAAAMAAGCGSSDNTASGSAAGGSGTGPIKLGFAVADSGPIAPYDVEPTQAAQLAVDEINAKGGVLGRKLEIVKKNTQSDKALSSNVANELVGQGVSAIITSCDFDYGSPAAIVAQGAKIPGISLCASDPKFADTKTIGNFAFSFAPGSDAEASGDAEWAYQKKNWRSVFVLQDENIEYTKALGKYFKARWKDLGGKVVGEDSFPGGDNVNIRSQATKVKQAGAVDFIYLPTWNPGGAAAIRQLRAAGVTTPILGPSALDGELLVQTAGKVSDVYFNPYICYAYCSGSSESGAQAFAKAFQAKTGKAPSTGYDIAGYNIVNALAKAMATAKSAAGEQVVKAMETMGPIDSPNGSFEVATAGCHKPTKMPLSFVQVTNGQFKFLETYSASQIPDVGDGNGCAGG